MIAAVIFDFDGTLTEQTLDFAGMRKAIEKIAEKYASPDLIRRLDGLYILEMIDELGRMLDNGGPAFSDEALARLQEMEVEGARGKEVYPYTRSVLGTLRGQGLRIGVITRNCTEGVAKVFPDAAAYVDALATRDDVREVKPKPGHLKAILAALGVEARQALVVGDHPTDMLAGKALGLRTVGVLAGKASRADLERAGADHVVADIRAVPDIVCSGDPRAGPFSPDFC